MSQQRLTSFTCRALRHRPAAVAEFARQELQQPRRAPSSLTLSCSESAVYPSPSLQSSQTIPLRPSRNALFARAQPPRSLLRVPPASSAAFSTTAANRSAAATLNPRVDDDGNPMFIEISPRAAKRLSEITASSEEAQHLRVTVTSGGCHGFQYLMSLEPSSKIDEAEDTVFEATETEGPKGQAKVVMDEASLELLSGSTVDFTTELIGSQFKINNPRATSSCGCGTSFDVNL